MDKHAGIFDHAHETPWSMHDGMQILESLMTATITLDDESVASDDAALIRKAAFLRAKAHLEARLEGNDDAKPVGRAWVRPIIVNALVAPLAIGGAYLTYLSVTMDQANWFLPLFLGALTVVLGAFCVLAIQGSKSTTPKRALTLYYRNLSAGSYRRAQDHVLPSDRDDFPRFMPRLGHLPIDKTGQEYRFDQESGFREFWKTVFRPSAFSRWVPKVKGLRQMQVGDDVVVATFSLYMTKSSLLQIMGIVQSTELQLQKIVVRVDDTWQMLNGEWMGEEEYDVDWLQADD